MWYDTGQMEAILESSPTAVDRLPVRELAWKGKSPLWVRKYVEAEEELRREGAGIAERVVEERSDKGGVRYVRNPLDKMASEYLANAKMWAVELGITPASSSKVKETVQQGGENPLAELLDMTM